MKVGGMECQIDYTLVRREDKSKSNELENFKNTRKKDLELRLGF